MKRFPINGGQINMSTYMRLVKNVKRLELICQNKPTHLIGAVDVRKEYRNNIIIIFNLLAYK